MKSYINSNETRLKNQQASLKNLENQVGQLDSLLCERSQGVPNNIEKNLKEEIKAMTFRNGRELEEVKK